MFDIKISFLLLLTVISLTARGQIPHNFYITPATGNSNQGNYSGRKCPSGGYIMAWDQFIGNQEAYLLRTNAQGSPLWSKAITSFGLPMTMATVMQTGELSSGNFFVLCSGVDPAATNNQLYALICLNPSGNLLWSRVYSDIEHYCGRSELREMSSGDLALFFHGCSRSLIVRTDPSGNVISTAVLTPGNMTNSSNVTSEAFPDGGYLIAGMTQYTPNGFDDLYIAKIDSNLQMQWNRIYNYPDQSPPSYILNTNDGNYLIAGTRFSGQESYLMKLDQNGYVLWHNAYTDAYRDWHEGTFLSETPNGEILSFGLTADHDNIIIVKMDSTGIPLSSIHAVNGDMHMVFPSYGIEKSGPSQYLISGFTIFSNQPHPFISSTDESGSYACATEPGTITYTDTLANVLLAASLTQSVGWIPSMTVTPVLANLPLTEGQLCVEPKSSGIGQVTSAPGIAVGPNPATSETVISLRGEGAGNMIIYISDITGRLVKQMDWDGRKVKAITVPTSDLNSGVYVIAVTCGIETIGVTKLIVE